MARTGERMPFELTWREEIGMSEQKHSPVRASAQAIAAAVVARFRPGEGGLDESAAVVAEALTAAEARGRQQAEQESARVRQALSDPFDSIECGLGVDSSEAAEGHMAEVVVRRLAELEERVQQAEQARDATPSKVCAEWHRTGLNCTEFNAVVRAGRDRAEAETTISALTQALKDYGQHKSNCQKRWYGVEAPQVACTCGLDAALTGAQA